jgi:hypothetical protein
MGAKENLELVEELQRVLRDLDFERYGQLLADDATFVVKDKDGRRSRYQIQSHLPLREAITQERTIGKVLDVLVESKIPRRGRRPPA